MAEKEAGILCGSVPAWDPAYTSLHWGVENGVHLVPPCLILFTSKASASHNYSYPPGWSHIPLSLIPILERKRETGKRHREPLIQLLQGTVCCTNGSPPSVFPCDPENNTNATLSSGQETARLKAMQIRNPWARPIKQSEKLLRSS